MAQFLDKIKLDIENSGSTTYDFGLDFDHVIESNSNNWSLRNFISTINNFFAKPMFMSYSKGVPGNGATIMECYIANGDGLDTRVLNSIN